MKELFSCPLLHFKFNLSLTVFVFMLAIGGSCTWAETDKQAAQQPLATDNPVAQPLVNPGQVHASLASQTAAISNAVSAMQTSPDETLTRVGIGDVVTDTDTEYEQFTQQEVVGSLASALSLINKVKQELKENQRQIEQAANEVVISELVEEQQYLQENLKKNNQNFVEIATGGQMDLNASQQFEEEPVDWKKEITEVVRPLVAEVKSVTSSQREKEKLRVELGFYKQRLLTLDASARKAKVLKEQAEGSDPAVHAELENLLQTIASRISEAESQIDVLNIKYRELQKKAEQGDWIKTLRSIVTGFLFQFLVAIAGAIAAYYCFGVFVVLLDRIDTELHPKTLFWVRAIQFFLRILGIFVAIGCYCAILMAFSQWALMSISVIVLVGLLLSLKDVLPQHLTEMRTILNMGSIREGERVNYNGIPWRVDLLDFYTEIYNRDLNATLRLPISEVAGLRSRVPVKSELWFPTRQGDYVILDDDTFGQVMRQSPDSVLLDYFGSLVSYQTADFLAAKPINLSRQKFTVFSVLGVDYKYQEQVTNVMLDQLNEYLNAEVKKLEFADCIISVRAEFDLADASSLNYKMILHCKGGAAKNYKFLTRWMQRVAVDCCNQYGWEIPFQQVTLHKPSDAVSTAAIGTGVTPGEV